MTISIVMASYNYAHLIEQAINSVLTQTYNFFELIIVDDGSTDNSVEIIKKYTESFNNIFLYQHENAMNKGLKETIKLGLKMAKGDYIAFLESDDIWDENHLKEKITIINNYPQVELIFNNIEFFGDKTLVQQNEKYSLVNKSDFFKFMYHELLKVNCIPTFSCVMVKREILKDCNFDTPMDAYLDWWLWMQFATRSKVYYSSKQLTKWRKHSSSYTGTSNEVSSSLKRKIFHKKLINLFVKHFDFSKLQLKVCFKLMIYILKVRLSLNTRLNKIFRSLLKTETLQSYIEQHIN